LPPTKHGQKARRECEGRNNKTEAVWNKYFNTRYTVDAVLKDTLTGAELFTYNTGSRESYSASQADTDNRAIIGAERKITEEFPGCYRRILIDGYFNNRRVGV
jgi:hypothetical protein